MNEELIQLGDFIVIQKQNYKKLYKINNLKSVVPLGKDQIEIEAVVGCKYFSFFELVRKGGARSRTFTLELSQNAKGLKDVIEIKTSGSDNRNIIDDGRSQKLSAAEIETLQNDVRSSSEIVEILISNSNTFNSKTEFSQEKYLKKKDKKYCQYIQILKPNLRLIADILYRLDPGKMQQIRVDTFSQIITMSNVNSEGNHLLYDSGTSGLIPAGLLSVIGAKTKGNLLYMHPGNMSSKLALQAMNYPQEQLDRCISVNIYSALREFYQGTSVHIKETLNETVILEQSVGCKRKHDNHDGLSEVESKVSKLETNIDKEVPLQTESTGSGKSEPKKPKWYFDNKKAVELLKGKLDSLVITCKEDPLNIFNELVQFVKPSRPFVIYYPVMEPLQQCYFALRAKPEVAYLKLSCNWLRNQQVLPDRTHPEVTMNGSSGYLLTGFILKL